MQKYTVTFYPDNKKIVVDSGTTILEAAISARIYLNSVCGGDGVCGKCKVSIRSEKKQEMHLACQALVQSDIEVDIPKESRIDLSTLSRDEQELRLRGIYGKAEDSFDAVPFLGDGLFKYNPPVIKLYLELKEPDFNDKSSDLERLYRAIEEKIPDGPIQVSLMNIRRLGPLLRSSGWKVTVVLVKRKESAEVIFIEPGNRTEKSFGFVFDIGTTTISAQLVDLYKKNILGTKVASNRQAVFGSDVIARIIYAKVEGGLEKLHNAVTDVMNEMIEAFAQEQNIDLNDVTCVSVAGNTTMMHLLLSIDPEHIRQEPYVPVTNIFPVVKASDAGIKINPHGLIFCVPGVASYVGGDITAGVVACNMHQFKEINILIDIGTNGEIVLGNSDWLISCAASAGPAFEGSGMSCGVRAVKGAIQLVKIKKGSFDVEYKTIGDAEPCGICGSGYIDLVCGLLKCGILDKNGKINRDIRNKRVREGKNGYEFVVENDIVITDSDLDNFKRAKAAIYSGISVMLNRMEIKSEEINKIFIAGGFGTSLNIESAVQIGLLPDLERDKYIFVGNSSLAGARQNLLSQEAGETLERVSKNITYFELSTEPQYMDEYMAALFFPHTDLNRFPSVRYE